MLLLIGEVIKYNTDTLTNPRSIYFNTDKQDSNTNTNTITMNTNNKNNPHQKNKKNTNTNTNKVTPENDHNDYAHGSISIKVTDDIQKSRQQVIALLSNKGNTNTHTNYYNNTNTNTNDYQKNLNTIIDQILIL